jgi:hypothetical protein
VLGEFGTQMWIGDIQFAETEDSFLLIDLPPHLNRLQDKYEWEKNSPLDEYTGYSAESPEPGGGYRSDVIAGFTLFPHLVFDYAENEGPVAEDPLENTGAEFVFLVIDNELLPADDPLGGREEIENTLADEVDSIRFWGGATGIESSYLDLLILNGQVSKDQIGAALKGMGYEAGWRIEPFTA